MIYPTLVMLITATAACTALGATQGRVIPISNTPPTINTGLTNFIVQLLFVCGAMRPGLAARCAAVQQLCADRDEHGRVRPTGEGPGNASEQ